MKKWIGIGLAMALLLGVLSGCSLFGKKANGFVLYGTKDQVEAMAGKFKKEAKESDIYAAKLTMLEGKKVLVLTKKNGEALVKKALLKKIDNNHDVKAIDKLPVITAEQGVLFAQDKVENATIDGAKLKYEGNIIIGDERLYADMYAIVDEATFTKMKGEEKSVGVLKFDKDPSKDFPNKNGVEASEMVTINKK
ncbi:hypothetical protein SAMN04487866_11169 [Thermoactinomyces sp. DSM 45891]|uniref:lipoprotein BA_5634 family protein n=1 Tax=Thermoactinomyces sp. DSM 45891 TaxID=1761907 RepID=UPI0009204A03|nr:lipoprotein BA_5634 family protein [Thermoactinomyces sp. DSM 45891]SFX55299.1 hypothetical protein SAMN04487866_11169 [Thermoactinomyces sp. DSM 45891]